MATRLKETDVVIVGLGAVGRVAALPLAQAGLDIVGLEAGTWLTKRDFAPDELRNNYRGWPQAAQKADQAITTHRPQPATHPAKPDTSAQRPGPESAAFRCASDDERRRWDFPALLGSELAAESVGL